MFNIYGVVELELDMHIISSSIIRALPNIIMREIIDGLDCGFDMVIDTSKIYLFPGNNKNYKYIHFPFVLAGISLYANANNYIMTMLQEVASENIGSTLAPIFCNINFNIFSYIVKGEYPLDEHIFKNDVYMDDFNNLGYNNLLKTNILELSQINLSQMNNLVNYNLVNSNFREIIIHNRQVNNIESVEIKEPEEINEVNEVNEVKWSLNIEKNDIRKIFIL